MAITKSARKEIKSSKKRSVFNMRRLRSMKTSIKELKTEMDSDPTQNLKEKFSLAQKAIDKAQKRGVIKKNTASRKKSRLAKFIKQSIKN